MVDRALGSTPRPGALLPVVLIIATAGLIYELVMAAVASYLLGDSVRQFSLIIGVYLSALGLGAYVSKFIEQRLAQVFVDVELSAALLGGLSAPALFLAHAHTQAFSLLLYSLVLVVGVLVGLELPLLMRLLERRLQFKDLIARALTFDYLGALLGSLAFSFWLVPQLGLLHTSIVCGLLNASVGLVSTWLLPPLTKEPQAALTGARIRAVAVLLILLVGLLQGSRLTEIAEARLYPGQISLAEQSHYQRVVISENHDSFALYLNGNLQFSSQDEYRYHEALVHPAMASAAHRRHILIGGGGDGLAVREVLRWPDVESITVVDLDERVTELARTHPRLKDLNQDAMNHPKVHVVNQDAMVWMPLTPDNSRRHDVILLDFPDPTNYSLGKLYSTTFYRAVAERLAPGGALAVQASSPLFALQAYWCVVTSIEHSGLRVRPYHAFVDSFGEWGYALAKHEPFSLPRSIPVPDLHYLSPSVLAAMFHFPPDMQRRPTQKNLLNNQALVGYYLKAWSKFDQ